MVGDYTDDEVSLFATMLAVCIQRAGGSLSINKKDIESVSGSSGIFRRFKFKLDPDTDTITISMEDG